MVEKMSALGRIVAAGSLRRLLLASLTIAAILLGLTAMHALSAGMNAHSGHAAQSQMSSGMGTGAQTMPGTQPMPRPDDSAPPVIDSAFVAATAVVSAQGSSEMWVMNCLLVGMVCALSLLFALIGLVLNTRRSALLSSIRKSTRVPRIAALTFVLPTTPSLTALSISRT